MGVNVFPTPTAATVFTNNRLTVATANTVQTPNITLTPGVYTISCVSSTVTTIEFYSNNGTRITGAVTSSGTVTVNLATTVDKCILWTNTGSNIVVSIDRVANILTSSASGTLDTISATGTYTGTSASGLAYAVVIGGGGGGSPQGGTAGNAAGIGEKLVALTGSMPVTIGDGGTATLAGGSSSFGGITATGGGGSGSGSGSSTGGFYNQSGGGPSGRTGGTRPAAVYTITGIASAAGGGGGNDAQVYQPGNGLSGTPGGGGGIGAGGGSGGSQISGVGGGGGGTGGAGRVYVLRF
jgi:hypothetical protein